MNVCIRDAQKYSRCVEQSLYLCSPIVELHMNLVDRSERERERLEQVLTPPLSVMVRVAFQCAGVDEHCDVQRDSSLADIQQLLCRLYRQNFPARKAVLTLDDNKYDAFVQYPFKTCTEGAMYEVEFDKTDEVLFFDKADRGLNITLEAEVGYDDAVCAGTTIGIEAWVPARRAVLQWTAQMIAHVNSTC